MACPSLIRQAIFGSAYCILYIFKSLINRIERSFQIEKWFWWKTILLLNFYIFISITLQYTLFEGQFHKFYSKVFYFPVHNEVTKSIKVAKTIKWEFHPFYLDQKFVKPILRLQIQKCYFNDPLKFDFNGGLWNI